MIRRWFARLFGRRATLNQPEPRRFSAPPPPPPPAPGSPPLPTQVESAPAAAPESQSLTKVSVPQTEVRPLLEPEIRSEELTGHPAVVEQVAPSGPSVEAPSPSPRLEARPDDEALISPRPELVGGTSSVRLVFEDGRVESLVPDSGLQDQLHYLVDHLAPGGESPEQAAAVKLVFEDGRVENLAVDPEEAARLSYLVDNLLDREGSETRPPGGGAST